jgi:hypothetical protein
MRRLAWVPGGPVPGGRPTSSSSRPVRPRPVVLEKYRSVPDYTVFATARRRYADQARLDTLGAALDAIECLWCFGRVSRLRVAYPAGLFARTPAARQHQPVRVGGGRFRADRPGQRRDEQPARQLRGDGPATSPTCWAGWPAATTGRRRASRARGRLGSPPVGRCSCRSACPDNWPPACPMRHW